MVNLILLIITFVALSQNAYAYLDGGTGNMLLQIIFGGIAGALAVVKIYWHKIKALFRKSEHK
ncbi:MAG: hypothetical protein LBL30_01530 [Holosporales bacterium]|jgi:hypothetical protein|nr:hypothetical protein [Holosporales bacterium]